MAVGPVGMDSQSYPPALVAPHVGPFSGNLAVGLPPLPSGRPHRQNAQKFKQRYNYKKQGQQSGPQGMRRNNLESYAPVPSLEALRRDNKRKARKHFRPGRDANRCPLSVPRAPDNTNSFLMAGPGISPSSMNFLVSPGNGVRQFHTNTPNPFQPGGTFKNSFGQLMGLGNELTELSAHGGINLYGTNEGLITRVAQNDDALSSELSESDPEDGFELHVEDLSAGNEPVPAHARARLEEQDAVIADLQEQNMTLKERISLLEQELTELRCQAALETAGVQSPDEDDAPEEHRNGPQDVAVASGSMSPAMIIEQQNSVAQSPAMAVGSSEC